MSKRILIEKRVYEEVKLIADKNEIDVTVLLNEMFNRMLNHHKGEVEEIIKKLKR